MFKNEGWNTVVLDFKIIQTRDTIYIYIYETKDRRERNTEINGRVKKKKQKCGVVCLAFFLCQIRVASHTCNWAKQSKCWCIARVLVDHSLAVRLRSWHTERNGFVEFTASWFNGNNGRNGNTAAEQLGRQVRIDWLGLCDSCGPVRLLIFFFLDNKLYFIWAENPGKSNPTQSLHSHPVPGSSPQNCTKTANM